MAENRFPFTPSGGGPRETVCLQAERVMDSCRDRDCFENVRVYLSGFGNDLLEHTGSVRPKEAQIIAGNIGVDPVAFNRGFYAVTARFFVRVTCECCVDLGRVQDVTGVAVLEKKVILFGGESNSAVYRSSATGSGFCQLPNGNREESGPTAAVEVVEPVFLDARIAERRDGPCCCVPGGVLPESVAATFDAPILPDDLGIRHILVVSLGLFSVVRLLRRGQYLVSACEYVIPEKECARVEEDDPCHVFRNMPFPVGAFSSIGNAPPLQERPGRCGCSG